MVGLSKLQRVAAGVLRIEEGPAFVARFRHLHSLGFPPMPASTRGKRFDYRADECLAVVLVLVLEQTFVSPAAAVAIVMTRWPEILRAVLRALERPGEASSIVTIAASGLGVSTAVGEASASGVELRISDEQSVGPRRREQSRLARGWIALDLGGILTDVRRELEESGGVRGEAFQTDLVLSMQEVGVPGAVRLRERDFYWTRATQALADPALWNALSTGGEWRPVGDVAVAAAYLSDPMSRERYAMSDPISEDGQVSFATAFGTILGLVGHSAQSAHPIGSSRYARAATSREGLLERLLEYARERAAAR